MCVQWEGRFNDFIEGDLFAILIRARTSDWGAIVDGLVTCLTVFDQDDEIVRFLVF